MSATFFACSYDVIVPMNAQPSVRGNALHLKSIFFAKTEPRKTPEKLCPAPKCHPYQSGTKIVALEGSPCHLSPFLHVVVMGS